MAAPQVLTQAFSTTAEPPHETERDADAVVLVGNPNVGKSALFGALTGTYVTVSNYPGTTVELTKGHASIGGRKIPLLDTPGATSFLPSSEDEQVTRDILLSGTARSVVVRVGFTRT